jgi:hypothetical protein
VIGGATSEDLRNFKRGPVHQSCAPAGSIRRYLQGVGLAQSKSLKKKLDVFSCDGLTGAGLKALAALPQLAELAVGGANLQDEDLATLADFNHLC